MATKEAFKTAKAIDPVALGGALAMRQGGFSDDEITSVFGYLPPIDMDRKTALQRLESQIDAEEGEFELDSPL